MAEKTKPKRKRLKTNLKEGRVPNRYYVWYNAIYILPLLRHLSDVITDVLTGHVHLFVADYMKEIRFRDSLYIL